jgi:hypothetical protein
VWLRQGRRLPLLDDHFRSHLYVEIVVERQRVKCFGFNPLRNGFASFPGVGLRDVLSPNPFSLWGSLHIRDKLAEFFRAQLHQCWSSYHREQHRILATSPLSFPWSRFSQMHPLYMTNDFNKSLWGLLPRERKRLSPIGNFLGRVG